MKKVFYLTIASFLIATITNAQINKGSVLLGGNIGFGNSKAETGNPVKQSVFNFNPVIGMAVKENLVLGINGTYGHSNITFTTPDKNESVTTGGGLFIRKYFPLASRFYLYGQGNISYTHSNAKQESSGSKNETKSNIASLGVAPGLAYALSKKFHLELGFNDLASLSITNYKTTNMQLGTLTTSEGSNFGFNAGLSTASPLNLGFRFFISK